MITLQEQLNKFIEQNIELIENHKWEDLYSFMDVAITGPFTKLMLKIHEDPLENMTYIPENFLREQRDITSFTIPNTVSKIYYNAFFKCDLRILNIPEGVTEIKGSAFEGNENLKLLTLPKSLKRIEQYAFADCSSLERIDCAATCDEFVKNLVVSNSVFTDTNTNVIHCLDGDVALVNGYLSIYYNDAQDDDNE